MSKTRIAVRALSSVALAGAVATLATAQPRVQPRGSSSPRLQQSKPSATEIAQIQRGQQQVARLRHSALKGMPANEKAALAGVTLAALKAPAVLSPQRPYLNADTYLRVSPQHSGISYDARANAIGVSTPAGSTVGQVSVTFRAAAKTTYVVECMIDTSKAKNKGALIAVIMPHGPKVTAAGGSQSVAMVIQNTSTQAHLESVHFWAAADFWILTRCEITPAKA